MYDLTGIALNQLRAVWCVSVFCGGKTIKNKKTKTTTSRCQCSSLRRVSLHPRIIAYNPFPFGPSVVPTPRPPIRSHAHHLVFIVEHKLQSTPLADASRLHSTRARLHSEYPAECRTLVITNIPCETIAPGPPSAGDTADVEINLYSTAIANAIVHIPGRGCGIVHPPTLLRPLWMPPDRRHRSRCSVS